MVVVHYRRHGGVAQEHADGGQLGGHGDVVDGTQLPGNIPLTGPETHRLEVYLDGFVGIDLFWGTVWVEEALEKRKQNSFYLSRYPCILLFLPLYQ